MHDVSHLTAEHMSRAAANLERLATMSGDPALRRAADRTRWRASVMAQGATLADLAASGDAVARALVGREAA